MVYTKHGVSQLTLGTAALAQPYAGEKPPDRAEARKLIWCAADAGCTLVDTAPGYGSEELLGEAFHNYSGCAQMKVATKVPARLRHPRHVFAALDDSRRALNRQWLDIVQVHNPTVQDFVCSPVLDGLREAKSRGILRWIGASVYTVQEATTALVAGVDVLQVPYNLLDQRMARFDYNGWGETVFAEARRRNVLVLGRSPWLRGMLAAKAAEPKQALQAAFRAERLLLAHYTTIADYALRFALAGPDSVIVGPRTVVEWDAAVRSANNGPLPRWRQFMARFCASDDPDVWDVRRWDKEVGHVA